MKLDKIICSLFAGAALITGFSSCDNDDYLNVTHTSLIDPDAMYETDKAALMTLTGCYDLILPSADGNGDPYKPYLFTGCHPTMDTQATGWDKDFMSQQWTETQGDLFNGWKQAYAGITRCNDFLSGLTDPAKTENLSEAVKKTAEGEARTIRAYHYFWLATCFGRVPMLETGENNNNTPAKARAKTYEDMWDFIIRDLKAASELLKWEPYDGQYGRCTKGMALAYLGDSYMWKAYRCPDVATENYNLAKEAFRQIVEEGPYQLNDSYTTLWDADEAWPKEAIFQLVLNEGDKWGAWGDWTEAHGWVGFYCGAPANGAWGTMALSWEIYDAFEVGDKRRDGSMVTACIPDSELEKIGKEKWKNAYQPSDKWFETQKDNTKFRPEAKMYNKENTHMGFNPFNQEVVGYQTFHREPSDPAPTVYSLKHWRNGRGTHWEGDQWLPAHIYMKRLPNVMLDYAECLFRLNGEGDATAWEMVNKIRNRAFGNQEVGNKERLTEKYLPYFKQLATVYGSSSNKEFGQYVEPTEYPIPFSETTTTVKDAKAYYTELKAEKGFTSETWKVAVNEERRKEFSAEWCLRGDMQKSGYMADHIEHNYPTGKGAEGEAAINNPWTFRKFVYNDKKMDMPIPSVELETNPLCDQNEAYIKKE